VRRLAKPMLMAERLAEIPASLKEISKSFQSEHAYWEAAEQFLKRPTPA
jgi:hypothetical protein